MKLSIASREGAVSEDEAREFARMIEEEAQDDDWVRVLYAVETPDTVRLEVVPARKTG